MKRKTLVVEHYAGYFLFLCIGVLFVALYNVLQPFVIDLILAAILATAFHGLYQWFLKKLHGRARLASFLTCMFIIVVIIFPLTLFTSLFIQEAYSATQFVYQEVQSGAFDSVLVWEKGGMLYDLKEKFLPFVDVNTVDLSSWDLKSTITETATKSVTLLASHVTNFLRETVFFLFHFFVLFFSMFYFFKDSKLILKKMTDLSPLPAKHDKLVLTKFKEISQATLYGIFLTAMVQGVLGGIGFFMVGLSNPIFWGTMMAFFALIPFLGTPIVWLPASLILFFGGNVVGGVFLFLWGAAVVSTIDNFLRPYLIHGRSRTYPLLTFLSVLGGLMMMGLVGILIGPLILTLFFVFMHIYELEYQER